MKFEDYMLNENILKAIDLLNYKHPTEVQRQSIPLVLEGKDVIVKSQTGSGKTAAFGIPICEKIVIDEKAPQALILTPTRELCVQIKEDITNIGRLKGVRCAAIFGKQPVSMQVRELKQRVHVIAGTPGRTLDHIERGNITLDKIKFLVIDESDKMLNMGFIDQVEAIINKLPGNRQTMLFSATMPEEIRSLCEKYMVNPVEVETKSETITANSINQVLYRVNKDEKYNLLVKLLYTENPESCIIFCSTKDTTDKLSKRLQQSKFSVKELHGSIVQDERLKTMKSFKRGEFRFLVATDVAGRGIDIEDLSLIINYDVPEEKESYVHRIGRTGRAGKRGKAITFAASIEEKYLRAIEEYLNYSIPLGLIPSEENVEAAKKKFLISKNAVPKPKKDKGQLINKQISKLYIGAGRKKKIRAVDIVGAILSIEGISADNIGVIDIQENFSYVDILDGKGQIVLDDLKVSRIKGKIVKVELAVK
ncbi:DEAD/DEAH box helicase [Candidatus Clostridium radicumherbarum]|uniref:ATP-dependent RNA helicase DbpA n=1 Tax=Candidatus Clostridium radicumherbarum TaxID=3381662 RepID=A0ABW8TQ26_9CLOT